VLNSFHKELYKDVEIKKSIGKIGLEKKRELHYFTLNGKKNFPFKYFEYHNEIINIEYLNYDISKILEIQEYLNSYFNAVSFNSMEMILESLSRWIKSDLINKYRSFIGETKELLNKPYNKENLINIVNFITLLDNQQEDYYEFFNIIAKGSNTPIADFLETLIFLLKLKLEDNNLNVRDFFDFYWEYKEGMDENGEFILKFFENPQTEIETVVVIKNLNDFIIQYEELYEKIGEV
jgi:hypothetical protein